MVKNKISKLLCSLVLLSPLGLNSSAKDLNKSITRINNTKSYKIEKEVEVIRRTRKSIADDPVTNSDMIPSDPLSYTFEDKWVNAVEKIIYSSIELNKTNLKTNGVVGTDSPGFIYSGDGFGGVIYSDGFTSFVDFKREIFKTILRDFLDKRLTKLTTIITERENNHDPKIIATACEEVKQIVQVFADNSFDNIISKFVDLDSINIPMKIVCINS